MGDSNACSGHLCKEYAVQNGATEVISFVSLKGNLWNVHTYTHAYST